MENRLPTSDKDFVESLIPQRFPFVMVHEITEYSESHLISGFEIREDNLFIQDGVFQASGMIEHQAQSVALHTGYQYFLLGKDAPTGYIGAIKSFEAEILPKTGDHLASEITILNEVMGVTLVDIVTRLNGKVIAKISNENCCKIMLMEIREDHIINIHNFLPHREPMLMADYILELTKEKVVTSFEIKEGNIFVHNNEFVEAGLIENLAQTCSSILGQSFFENPEADTKVIGFITNIKKIEVFALPKVGDKIISKASLISQFENICHIFCETFHHDELLIRADISLFIQEVKS